MPTASHRPIVLPREDKTSNLANAIISGVELTNALTRPREINFFEDVTHPGFSPNQQQLAYQRLHENSKAASSDAPYHMLSEKFGPEFAEQYLTADDASKKFLMREAERTAKKNESSIEQYRSGASSGKRLVRAADAIEPLIDTSSNAGMGFIRKKLGLPESFGNLSDELIEKQIADVLGITVRANFGGGRILQSELINQMKALPNALNSKEAKKRLVELLRRTGRYEQLKLQAYKNVFSGPGRYDADLPFKLEEETERLAEEEGLFDDIVAAPVKKKVVNAPDQQSSEPPTSEPSVGPSAEPPVPLPDEFLEDLKGFGSAVGQTLLNILPSEQEVLGPIKTLSKAFSGEPLTPEEQHEIAETALRLPGLGFDLTTKTLFRAAATASDVINKRVRAAVHPILKGISYALPESWRDTVVSDTIKDDPAFVEDVALNLATLAIPIGGPLTKAQRIGTTAAAILPPALKHFTDAGPGTQLTAAIAPIVMSSIMNPASGLKFAGRNLAAAKNMIPEEAKIGAQAARQLEATAIKSLSARGLALDFAEDKNLIKAVHDLRGNPSVRDLIQTRELMNKSYPQFSKDATAKNAFNTIRNAIDETIRTSPVSPEALAAYETARITSAAAFEGQISNNWIKDNFDKLSPGKQVIAKGAGYGLASALFGLNLPKAVVAGGSAFAYLGAKSAYKTLSQMTNDPTLRKYYLEMFANVSKRNFPSFIKYAEKLAENYVAPAEPGE